jgi:pimeloyl-ACP methyl ester carboxylesterase
MPGRSRRIRCSWFVRAALAPDLWKGCVAAKASLGGLPQLDERHSKPPILFVIGDSDPILPSVQADIRNCRNNGWPYEFYLIENYTHLNVDPFGRRNKERQIAQFLIEHATR